MKKQKQDSERQYSSTQREIIKQCDDIKELLLEKNESYADSFSSPINIFAKGLSPDAQIRVRIDDKLKRIACGKEYKEEVTEIDLIGYLILKRVENIMRKKAKKIRKKTRRK